MAIFKTLDDVDVAQKRVLLRADLNVPLQNGVVTDATRIERLLPTVQELSAKKAVIILLSHFGRPKGKRAVEFSLKPLVNVLSRHFGKEVSFSEECVGEAVQQKVQSLLPGDILLLENLRFYPGEEANDPVFAAQLAKLGNVYVNDAFSASHRSHASIVALAKELPAVMGRGMEKEIAALQSVLKDPKRPLLAIIGGSKVSTKLDLLKNLIEQVDFLVVGGGMANTFLAAEGYAIGQSLYEPAMIETALEILNNAAKKNCEVILPLDVMVAKDLKENEPYHSVDTNRIPEDQKILDLGPKTIVNITQIIQRCYTLIWNGPVGVFEVSPFDQGTTALAQAIAKQTALGKLISVAGGGDTLAALVHAGVMDQFSYTSTAGGAFLEWLEGKSLPGVEVLKR